MWLERYMHAVAGGAIAFCGFSMILLGLYSDPGDRRSGTLGARPGPLASPAHADNGAATRGEAP